MSAAPFMQMYWSDYFGDTRHLTCEQHGAYLQLLGAMWLGGGSLLHDDAKLARMTGCTSSRWAKIAPEVLDFFDSVGGLLTNKRLTIELQKAHEKSIKRAEAGSRGGKAKSLKTHKTHVANATDLLKHLPEPELEKEENKSLPSVSAKPKAKAARRCPEHWSPSQADLLFAMQTEGFNPGEIERELSKMRDHHFTSPRSDWSAVFRNWIRTAAERKPRPHVQPSQNFKRAAREDNLSRSLEGFDAVAYAPAIVVGGRG